MPKQRDGMDKEARGMDKGSGRGEASWELDVADSGCERDGGGVAFDAQWIVPLVRMQWVASSHFRYLYCVEISHLL